MLDIMGKRDNKFKDNDLISLARTQSTANRVVGKMRPGNLVCALSGTYH